MTEEASPERRPQRTLGSLRPPTYVNVPVSLVYASGSEAAILTLIRIVGLCWTRGGRRTPAVSRETLAWALGRSRRTLDRHLAHLQEQGWLQIDRQESRLILRPCLDGAAGPVFEADPAGNELASGGRLVEAHPSEAGPVRRSGASFDYPPYPEAEAVSLLVPERNLQRALAAAGIQNPVRDELACNPGIDPLWVRGWQLWTQHPDRASLHNPAGFIVQQLRSLTPPPGLYQQLSALTPEEIGELRVSRWTGGYDLDDRLRALRVLYLELFPQPEG